MKKQASYKFGEEDMINIEKKGGGWALKYTSDKADSEGPETITGAITNLAQESFRGVTRIGSILSESAVENMTKTGEALAKYGLFAVGKSIDLTINNTIGSEIDNKTVQEVSELAMQKLKKVIDVLVDMSKDPEMKELLKKVGKTIGELLQNVLETAREPLKQATVKAIDIGRDVGSESLAGATSFAVDMTSVVASEIPVLGGLVDLTIALGRAFNSGMKAFKKGSGNAIQVATIMNTLISEIIPKIDTGVNDGIEIKNKLMSISQRIIGMVNGTSNTIKDLSKGVRSNIDDVVKDKSDSVENSSVGGAGVGKKRNGRKRNDDIIEFMVHMTRKKRGGRKSMLGKTKRRRR